jgi:hypothetical protein
MHLVQFQMWECTHRQATIFELGQVWNQPKTVILPLGKVLYDVQ